LRAKDAISRALRLIDEDAQEVLVAVDLKEAVVALGEVSGEEVSEEVINTIFERFCVGK
jgi:tRNA modification GTPase